MLKTIRLKTLIILDICIILYFFLFFLKGFLLFDNIDFITNYYNMYDNLVKEGSIIVNIINIFENFFFINLILTFILVIVTIVAYYFEDNRSIKKLLGFLAITLSIILLLFYILRILSSYT